MGGCVHSERKRGELLMANYLTTDTDLTTVADAIRTKGGTSSALEWPSGYAQAIDNIPSGIIPIGTIPITSNGTYDVTNYASANVSVESSGGGLEPILTYPIGALTTTSTTGTSAGVTITVPNIDQYDLLLVDARVNTAVSSRHVATVSYVLLTEQTGMITPKTGVSYAGWWNLRRGNRSAYMTNAQKDYGIYVGVAIYDSGSVRLSMYMRYDNIVTGTINGTYTAHIYGVNLFSLD